jgi:hypothetical protein
MTTISEIQRKLKQFNSFASESEDPAAYQKRWKELFHMPLSSQSAHSFASYYRDMRSNTRKHSSRKSRRQHGGAAPLDYAMTPGMNIQAYGRFPIEAGTDPASVRNLDVYFKDSLTADCGVKDSSLHVPANMGSNQVGGARRASRRAGRKVRSTMRRRKQGQGQGQGRRRTFRQRGGDLLESITARMPFVNNSSVAPNLIQTAQNMYTGGTQPVPAPADPALHTWEPRTHGVGGLINPGVVAYVPNDVGKLANPAPWMTSS